MKDEKLIAALKIQSKALEEIRRYFRGKDFVEVMPVILSTTTDPLGPDPNSSIIKIPKIECYDQELVVTQSMILQKQLLIYKGLEKLFVISPNVRLEREDSGKSGRHLFEFSQADFEIAGAKKKDVMSFMEGMFESVYSAVKKDCIKELSVWGRTLPKLETPFKVFTTYESEAEYGPDWEDIMSKEATQPFWTLSHKREFYEREDPDKPGYFHNYDLVYPEGFGEALSGSEREWKYNVIVEKLTRDGLLDRYEPYLKFAKKGLISSAGAGFGVERLTRFLTGAKHIGDIQAFRRVPGESVII